MKRYQFSLRLTLVPSTKFAPEYWNNQRGRFLKEFKPYAIRYKRRQRIATSLLLGFMLGICSFAFIDDYIPEIGLMWIAVLLVAGVFIAGGILAFGLKLVCPVCRNRLEPATGLYCPQCGSEQFQYGRHLRGPLAARYPYCPACDSTIDEGDGELYLAVTKFGDVRIVVSC